MINRAIKYVIHTGMTMAKVEPEPLFSSERLSAPNSLRVVDNAWFNIRLCGRFSFRTFR